MLNIEDFCNEYPKNKEVQEEINKFLQLKDKVPKWGLYHLIDYLQNQCKEESDSWWFYEELYNNLDICNHQNQYNNFCSYCGKLLNLNDYMKGR